MSNNKNLISEAKKSYENKNFFDAKSYLLMALKGNKMDKKQRLNIYILISDVSYKTNDFDNAEKYLLKTIEEGKLNSDISNQLGNIYLKKRNYKKAEKSYLKAIDLNEDNEIALINLAILYHNLGKQNEAIFFYKEVIKKNPKNFGALYNLSNIDKTTINEKTINILNKKIIEKNISNFDIASCFFLLANEEKGKKNFSKEIDFLEKANKFSFIANEKRNNLLNNYWLKEIPKKIREIKYFNDENYLTKTSNVYPIFIIGLPRCGSTLIESIISSGENKVENLGETNLVNWAILNENKDFLKTLNENEKVQFDFDETTKKLLNAFHNLKIEKDKKKIIFSEKSLENFYYIDIILKIFPNAKFINPYRNLHDNIFAIYKQFLPNISWSHSIENILSYIDSYLSTIKFFKKKYSDNILSFSLENFTADPEKLSEEIYKFCNLNWNKDCLNFYQRKDLFINTASNNQIRGNVKKYDEDKYKPYKEILSIYKNKYNWL